MRCTTILLALVAFNAMAQTPPAGAPAPSPKGSVSGVVRDADSGAPIANASIFVGPGGRETTTDARGAYKIAGLDPREYRVMVMVRPDAGMGGMRADYTTVNLGAGQDLAGIDFRLLSPGRISGKVVDENKEPVPDLHVFLVGREYSRGALRYGFRNVVQTNDQGEYDFQGVDPNYPYLVLAEKRPRDLQPVSDAPADPKSRKRAVIPTYYPNSPSPQGAQPITLRSGEHREGADIRIARTPSFCIEGTLESGTGPGPLRFQIAEGEPTSGSYSSGVGGGVYMREPGGVTGPDGKIRICDLHPGEYRLTVLATSFDAGGAPPFYSVTPLIIADEDVRGLKIGARPSVPLPVTVVWDGAAPETPVDAQISVDLRPANRAPFRGELDGVKVSIPGEASFSKVFLDEYQVSVRNVPGGFYVKDIQYAGMSVLAAPLRVGSAMGEAGLRVAIARDGGTVATRVADKDGNPVRDAYVYLLPDGAATEAEFATRLVSGRANQAGMWTSRVMAPGKYYALATNMRVDPIPEQISKLWAARSKGKEVVLDAKGSVQVSLEPVALQ